MSESPATVTLMGLSRLERLELEDFLKSWEGGGAWGSHTPEIRELHPGEQTLGQPAMWMFILSSASPLIYAAAQWIAAKRRTVTIEIRAPDGRVKRTVRVNETTPHFGPEGAKSLAEELTKASESSPE